MSDKHATITTHPLILPIKIRDSITNYISNHPNECKQVECKDIHALIQFWERMNQMFAKGLGYDATSLHKEYCIATGLVGTMIRERMLGTNEMCFLGYKFTIYPEMDTESSRYLALRASIVVSRYGGVCIPKDVTRSRPQKLNIDVERLPEREDGLPYFKMNYADVVKAVKCQSSGIILQHWPFVACCKPCNFDKEL